MNEANPRQTDEAPTGPMDLQRVWGSFRRHWLLIMVCCIVAGIAVFALSEAQPNQYTATVALNFNNSGLAQELAGIQVAGNADPQATQDTNVALVKLGDVAARTSAELHGVLTPDQVRNSLSVSPDTDTSIVELAAVAPRPVLAARVANTYSRIFVQEQQNASTRYISSALAVVQRQLAALPRSQQFGTQATALQNRAQQLQLLASTQSQSVSVAQRAAAPTTRSSPQPKRNTVFGLIAGLLFGAALALLLDQLDRRIKSPEDAQRIYRLPLLGAISLEPAFTFSSAGAARAPKLAVSHLTETFQLIRAQLRYFNVDRQLTTIMVVSAGPGDGKTFVSANLAAAGASSASRTLLMECDLRRPRLAQTLGLPLGPGTSEVLVGSCSDSDAIRAVPLVSIAQGSAPEDALGAERTLDVLVAGTIPVNPGELLESHSFERLLGELKSRYDLVILDTAPLGVVSDAFPLLSQVDGVIVVSRIGRNRTDVAARLRDTLDGTSATVLGVVANGIKRKSGTGYEGYGYGYAYTGAPRQPRRRLGRWTGRDKPDASVAPDETSESAHVIDAKENIVKP